MAISTFAIGLLPTFAQVGMPDFEAATWFGIFAPAGLAPELRDRIYRDVSAIVAAPAMTAKLIEMGSEVNNYSPAQFEAFIDHWSNGPTPATTPGSASWSPVTASW